MDELGAKRFRIECKVKANIYKRLILKSALKKPEIEMEWEPERSEEKETSDSDLSTETADVVWMRSNVWR